MLFLRLLLLVPVPDPDPGDLPLDSRASRGFALEVAVFAPRARVAPAVRLGSAYSSSRRVIGWRQPGGPVFLNLF